MFWFRPLFSCLILVCFEHTLCATPLTNTTEQKNQEGCEEPQQSTSTSRVVYLKHCTADKYINIAEGPKILEVQGAFSLHARRVTLQENAGKNGPSVWAIRPAHPHDHRFCAPIHERKSHVVRRAAWDLEEDVFTMREKLDENRATSFSLSEVWCLPSPSTTVS